MKLYYRISDNSYKKPKLIGATKETCLTNFCYMFHEIIFGRSIVDSSDFDENWVPPMNIIADRCERKTVKMIADSGIPYTASDKGNAGSFQLALEMAVESHSDDDLIYFVEDDYLHDFKAPKMLEEGIKRADYVTLYDHPDKYTRYYNMGEYSKVIKTESSHWRFTASTCMTFASKVKTLKEDMEVWKKHTSDTHPWDHKIFVELGERGRKLAVPIPGAACHTDLTFDGHIGKVVTEPWAIELMIQKLEGLLEATNINQHGKIDMTMMAEWAKTSRSSRWDKLVALDAVCKEFKIEV